MGIIHLNTATNLSNGTSRHEVWAGCTAEHGAKLGIYEEETEFNSLSCKARSLPRLTSVMRWMAHEPLNR